MAENSTSNNFPEILVLGPPSVFRKHESEFASMYRLLKPWESPLPLSQYLSTQAQNTQAALCSGVIHVNTDMIRRLPSLRLLVTFSAGLNTIDLVECRNRGIVVANAATIFSTDVADLAVGLVIDVLRKISFGNRFVRSARWPAEAEQVAFPLGARLRGKHVGIVGLGSIGLEVAKRLNACGCNISYYSRKKKPFDQYSFHSNILKLAVDSDILVLCCALNEETRHLINKDVLLALGKEGVVVNIARGAVIDEKELVVCLERGDIAGAGLDVFEHEPHVPKQLLELDNVVLSPHFAVFTEESFRDSYELACGNLEAFFCGKPLLSPIPNEKCVG